MKKLQISKFMSVFFKRSVSIYLVVLCVFSTNSCDVSNIEPTIPESKISIILKDVPIDIIADMQIASLMTINSQRRVDHYLNVMNFQKNENINKFRNKEEFSKLSQDAQLELIRKVLGFGSVEDYSKYANFLDNKIKKVSKWSKDNNIPLQKLSNQLNAVSGEMMVGKKLSARLQSEEIPQEWIDANADQGSGGARCEAYDTCMRNKVGEMLAGAVGAAAWGAITTGPAGAGAGFLGGLVAGGFRAIYASAWGDCAVKRQACKIEAHPVYGIRDNSENQ